MKWTEAPLLGVRNESGVEQDAVLAVTASRG